MTRDIRTTLTLVRRAKEGETEALNLLFDRYLQRVVRIVRARLGPGLRERMESGDVVQQVMIRALKAFDRFEAKDEAAFLHWIGALVQREICDLADYHGARKRTARKEVPRGADAGGGRSDLERLPAESRDRQSFRARLREEVLLLEAALDRLTEAQREVIVMRHYEGMSFRDIGDALGCSEDAARMKFARAMNALTDGMTHE